MNYHLGEWISIHARAERVPPRFTVSITLGDLPEGWQPGGKHARTWSGLVGLVLIAPFVILLTASVLHNLGLSAPYSWLSGSTFAILAGTVSLFIGIPVALPSRGITRRQALAAALATGVGVGAVRLLGGSMQQLATPLPGSATGWISPLKSESARVMHLLRRTAFGYSPAQLETALSDGFDKTVDRLIESKPAEPPPLEAATTPGGRFPIAQLQQWWINHMLTTQTPFAERMTLFWHGHFTSDYRKAADNTFMYWQNLTWRRMAMTDLPAMLLAATPDPAMLRYLDLATSTGQNPNENYSRELMELFTMRGGNFGEA